MYPTIWVFVNYRCSHADSLEQPVQQHLGHEYWKEVCKERGTSTAGRETGEDQGSGTGVHHHHEWKRQRTEFITKTSTTTKKKNSKNTAFIFSLKSNFGGLERWLSSYSTWCSRRGPRFSSQNPQVSGIPAPEYSMPSSGLLGPDTNTVHIYTCRQNTIHKHK